MMKSNLEKISKDLKRFSKRCKTFKYTEGALLAFILGGIISFSSTTTIEKSIENQRIEIDSNYNNLRSDIKKARNDNDKLLKNHNLELIQLMEQGDHVVKSPWSSWQFGINTFLSGSSGTYKGYGDKTKDVIFERNKSDKMQSWNKESYKYNTTELSFVQEPNAEMPVSAAINPKQVIKGSLNIAEKTASLPNLPQSIKFKLPDPKVSVPSAPATPAPPNFSIVLGADCNVCHSSGNTPRQRRNPNFNLNGRATDSIQSILHYTWGNNRPSERSYAFKMYSDASSNFTVGTNLPTQDATYGNGLTTPAPNNIYFNSYNFGDNDEFGVIAPSQSNDMNHQHFFVGGSRFIEADNAGNSTILIPNGYTLNLGGILTLGLVSQGNGVTQQNKGVITDKEEKNDNWIINMPYDTTGPGAGKYLTINGPDVYHVKRSEDGYVGYKVGLALVQEDAVSGGVLLNDTDGEIDFRGERSIGLYTYLPSILSNRDMINKGKINLSGSESYGMKFGATETTPNSIDFINDTDGVINLRKNPNGVDKADGSVGMALTKDDSVAAGVKLGTGQGINKGTINLTDVSNSTGMFVSIESDLTNEGTININSQIPKANNPAEQKANIGMRADGNNSAVLNKNIINLEGSYATGLLANNGGMAHNIANSKIKTGTLGNNTVSNGTGMVALSGTVTNDGEIELKGGNNNTGIFLSKGTAGTNSNGTNNGNILVTGDKGTGIFVNESNLTYTNGDTKITNGNALSGIVVYGTGSSATLNGGSITVGDNTNYAGEITTTTPSGTEVQGSYGLVTINGGSTTGTGTTVNAYIKGSNSVGIYASGNTSLGNTNINTKDGAVNYMATNGSNLTMNGGIANTGQSSLLFYTNNGNITLNNALNATVEGGSTIGTRGTAFYYTGTPNTTLETALATTPSTTTNYANFGLNDMSTWLSTTFNGTENNLTLNMQPGSRLFLASGISTNLTAATPSQINNQFLTTNGTTINGTDYVPFMLYHSLLNIDASDVVNLDNPNDPYLTLEMASSSIQNDGVINGTINNQVAMAQENDSTSKGIVTLRNNGTINLSGNNSTAMYTNYGYLINNGTITIGDNSTGIYGINETELENQGTINLGSNSTGMYSEGTTTLGLKNDGNIISTGNNSIGMTYKPNGVTGTVVENNGVINMGVGDQNTGIYVTGTGTYTVKNNGTITLGDSASLNNPNVGIYSKLSTVKTENNGTLTVGNNAVGVFGYESDNNGTITTGNGGIGIYTQGGTINQNGTINMGTNEAVGIYEVGNNSTINTGPTSSFNIGDTSFGIVDVGSGNTINSNTANVTLGNDSVYIYTNDNTGTINNNTNITSTGNQNFAIYSNGNVTNNGAIDFSNGVANVGIYSTGGTALNSGTGSIIVGASNPASKLYSVGMSTGYYNSGSITNQGQIINDGVIRVQGQDSIGMYAVGRNTAHSADVINNGTISLETDNTTGIYLDHGAIGENYGTITTEAFGNDGTQHEGIKGVVIQNGSYIKNYGTINIQGADNVGIYTDALSENNITGDRATASTVPVYTGSATSEKIIYNSNGVPVVTINTPPVTNPTVITYNGNVVPSTGIDTIAPLPNVTQFTENGVIGDISATDNANHISNASLSEIGMYVDTSGINYTNPINGLGAVTLRNVNLYIGTEAGAYTNSKVIQIGNNIIDPYNVALSGITSSGTKINTKSSSLTWIAQPVQNRTTGLIDTLYMIKIPYTTFAKDTNTYNFLDGLEQRYDMNALDSREKQLFNKLNDLGKGESHIFTQAVDEMMGHQYANVQQRINQTGNLLDKEFKYLYDEWRTASKQSNKVKIFGMKNDYKTDTAGIIDYNSNAYGIAYLHEDETVKLGDTTGWYAGAVHNRFRFKDIGGSKEEQTMLKAGIFKSTAFDDNNHFNWTVAGEIFGGINEMKRKYWVVDDVFSADSKNYYSYGVALKNEVSKKFRTSERTTIKPYASLDMEYGRFSNIKEDTGQMRLEVKGNDYYSIKPELGVQFKYTKPFGERSQMSLGLTAAYENELGKVNDVNNKARVNYTNADWYNLRGEKENRSGNGKFDLNFGIDNTRVGFTANIGYDTINKNIRGGLGIRAIY